MLSLVATNAFASPAATPIEADPVAPPAPPSCYASAGGTCGHYYYGDGALPEIEADWIQGVNHDWHQCTIENTNTGVTCTIDSRFCPVPAPPGMDGHQQPGVATCTGCTMVSGSINEAKCCLMYGIPTDPVGHPYC
jgi:hypothetical protein